MAPDQFSELDIVCIFPVMSGGVFISSSMKYSDGFWRVYVHINKINGKRYVGITSQKVEYRWDYGNGYKNNKYFTAAIQKYGWDNFEHIVLYNNLCKQDAVEKEIELIAKWNTKDRRFGYNLTDGGEGIHGYDPPEELRKLWSDLRRGTKRSAETKARMSLSSSFRRPEIQQKSIESAYTLDGEYVQTFNSIVEAGNTLGLSNAQRKHITDCCKGSRKSAGNYIWKYTQ